MSEGEFSVRRFREIVATVLDPDDVHPHLYLAAHIVGISVEDCLRILPSELAAHPHALIAMQQNLSLLDGLESKDAIAAVDDPRAGHRPDSQEREVTS